MLETIFADKPGFILASIAVSLVILLGGMAIARRSKARNPWAVGFFSALVAMEVSVTLLLPGAVGVTDGVCYLNRTPAHIFATTQGLMNIAMFIPIGFFAVMATRSPALSLCAGAALSIVTEFAQATIFGRNCDSNDFGANFIGAAVGVAVAVLTLSVSGSSRIQWRSGLRKAGIFSVVFLVACGIAVNTVITPVALDDSSIQLSSPDQERAADAAMNHAFDDHVDITKVTLRPGTDGAEDEIVIAFPNGIAQLSWPSRDKFSVLLEPESTPGQYSFPLDPPADAPKDEGEAQKIAHTYAQSRYAEQLQGATVRTFPVGEDAEFGWITSWRISEDGVLLPNRLDVQVNRAGRVSQMNVRTFSEEYEIPRDRLSKNAAMEVVENKVDITPSDASEHLLKVEEKYRPVWVVAIEHSPDDIESFFVDSRSGELIENIPGVTGGTTSGSPT